MCSIGVVFTSFTRATCWETVGHTDDETCFWCGPCHVRRTYRSTSLFSTTTSYSTKLPNSCRNWDVPGFWTRQNGPFCFCHVVIRDVVICQFGRLDVWMPQTQISTMSTVRFPASVCNRHWSCCSLFCAKDLLNELLIIVFPLSLVFQSITEKEFITDHGVYSWVRERLHFLLYS